MAAFCESFSPYRTVKYLPDIECRSQSRGFDLREDTHRSSQQVAWFAVTLERRRKQIPEETKEHESDTDTTEDVRATSEAARRDAARRASELIARLRRL
jgi:hypothetical protein